jgi:NTE family protein
MTFIDKARGFLSLRAAPTTPWPPAQLSLALQGGGSFGAFGWGVLDRLLEDHAIAFDSISGSSAGAINAVVMTAGLIEGGRDGARQRLAQFWKRISSSAGFLPPTTPGFDLILRAMSPCQFNPFNINPLREALEAEVDFERLRGETKIKLLIGVTRVRNGRLRILTNSELSVDAILASACLPLLHHAVELDGEPYWDGGYAANPPLIPLVRASDADHILIVQLTPTTWDRAPTTPREVIKRLEQIQFNATLNSELEALKDGKMIGLTAKLRRLRIGRISAEEQFAGLAEESAANVSLEFLERLHQAGRDGAGAWLRKDMPAIPVRTPSPF